MAIYGFNSYVQRYAPASSVELTNDSLVVPVNHESNAARRYDEYEREIQRVPWAYGAASASIGIAGIAFFVFMTLMSADAIPHALTGLTLIITGVVMFAIVATGLIVEYQFHRKPLRNFKDDLIHHFGARFGFPFELILDQEINDERFHKIVELMDKKRFTERRIECFQGEATRLQRILDKASPRARRGTVHESRQATFASLNEAVSRERERLQELNGEISLLTAKAIT